MRARALAQALALALALAQPHASRAVPVAGALDVPDESEDALELHMNKVPITTTDAYMCRMFKAPTELSYAVKFSPQVCPRTHVPSHIRARSLRV